MLNSAPFLRFAIAGLLTRDYLVLPDGRVAVDILGGNLLYTAAGTAIWDEYIGLLSRVNESFPQQWLKTIRDRGMDTRGIQVDTEPIEQRNFIAYPTLDQATFDNPLSHFSRVGQPFPKTLLGYQQRNKLAKNLLSQEGALRIKDIPFDYLDVTAMHICAMDYATQTRLPSFFRQGHVTTISLLASDDYMGPIYWDKIGTVLKGINAFICTENQIRNLFLGKTSDLWDMVDGLTPFGCEFIVIYTNNRHFLLFDHIVNKRYDVPAYNSNIIDPTGCLDSFCGGFLAGLRTHHQPLQSALQGSISASLTQEGVGPFYCMDSLPRLVNARLENLRLSVVQV